MNVFKLANGVVDLPFLGWPCGGLAPQGSWVRVELLGLLKGLVERGARLDQFINLDPLNPETEFQVAQASNQGLRQWEGHRHVLVSQAVGVLVVWQDWIPVLR